MDIKQIEKIFNNKVDLNQYWLLFMIESGEDLTKLKDIRKVEGILNLMKVKGWIEEDLSISSKGKQILEENKKDPKKFIELAQEIEKKKELQQEDVDWYISFHKKMKQELKAIIGKEQVMGFGNVYFIPSAYDFKVFINRFLDKYKIDLEKEKDKIEKIILNHIKKCAKEKKFSPAVKYFITKEGTGSQLATALEDFEEINNEDNKLDIDEYTTEG